MACVGVAAALLAFEVVLQGVAYFVWRRAEAHAAAVPHSTAPRALCVGDSFTYGLGASEPAQAYPKQAERLCAQLGQPIEFINRGWAGQTSREVLQRLPSQLVRFQPTLVYVLVGTNDLWQRPRRLTRRELAAAPARGFPFYWRTGRFVQLVGAWLHGSGSPDPTPFVGSWHAPGYLVHFSAEGRLCVNQMELDWRLEPEGLIAIDPTGWRQPVQWACTGEGLRLRLPSWDREVDFAPGLPQPGTAMQLEQGWAALRGGYDGVARGIFAATLAADPQLLRAHAGYLLTSPTAESGAAAQRERSLERLQRHARDGDEEATALLMQVLWEQDAHEAAVDLALAQLTRPATRAAAVRFLAEHTPGSRAEERVLASLATAPAATPKPGERSIHAALQRLQARLLRRRAAPAALRETLRAVLATGDPEPVIHELRADGAWPSRAALDAALAATRAAGAERAVLEDFVRRVEGATAGPAGTLRGHLQEIVRCIRAAGATPVFLTYPGRIFAPGEAQAALRDVARQAGIAVIDHGEAFAGLETQLTAVEVDAHFVPDGHCSDRGYGVMARAVAEHAIRAIED
ncbi:MAG: GDSL-type esterase/lipase family protein [Planctomycetota bacterium]